ncbi:MAG: LysR substrate-binding domain-containing protein [Myxococcales bacterium]
MPSRKSQQGKGARRTQGPAAEIAEPKNGNDGTSVGLRALEIFLEVEARRSFSSAARALSLSQPTVTQRIQSLEESLGVQLFNRGQGPVEPTAAALVLKLHAERLLAMRNDMLAELRGVTGIRTGVLRIAASTTPGGYLLPPLLLQFHAQYPGVRVVMNVEPSDLAIEQVLSGVCEIGVVGKATSDPRLVAEPFLEDDLVLIGRRGHPALAATEVTLEALARHPLIAREKRSASRQSLEALFARARRSLHVSVELGSTEAVKLAVQSGDGLALVSRRAVENELALGLLDARPHTTRIVRQFHLVHCRVRALSPAAQAFREHLLQARKPAAPGSARRQPSN